MGFPAWLQYRTGDTAATTPACLGTLKGLKAAPAPAHPVQTRTRAPRADAHGTPRVRQRALASRRASSEQRRRPTARGKGAVFSGEWGARGWIRTADQGLMSPLLYH